MKSLEEIKANVGLHIQNEETEPLVTLGCSVAIDGFYVDPVTRRTYRFVFSDEPNFEHLSVSCRGRTPSWDEMCRFKDMFWKDEEECVEFHPSKSDYVNLHEHCLHIWRFKHELPEEWSKR